MATRQRTLIKKFDTLADWTALNVDSGTLILGAQKFSPTGSIGFAKSGATLVAGGISAATDVNLISPIIYRDDDLVGVTVYLGSLTNLTDVFVRLGSSSANYLEWHFLVAGLQVGWNAKSMLLGKATILGGTGWDMQSVKYIAVGVTMGGAANTLTGTLVDAVYVDQTQPGITV